MISLKDMLGNADASEFSVEALRNAEETARRANILLGYFDEERSVNSGLRTWSHHLEIYHRMGITDLGKIPKKSKHLFGQAVDLRDPKHDLYLWAFEHQNILKESGLWCEMDTPTWLHCQIVPPASGRRFFIA